MKFIIIKDLSIIATIIIKDLSIIATIIIKDLSIIATIIICFDIFMILNITVVPSIRHIIIFT